MDNISSDNINEENGEQLESPESPDEEAVTGSPLKMIPVVETADAADPETADAAVAETAAAAVTETADADTDAVETDTEFAGSNDSASYSNLSEEEKSTCPSPVSYFNENPFSFFILNLERYIMQEAGGGGH